MTLSCLQALDAAFKNETIGLATREEFLNKKNTLKDRQVEEAKRKRERELQLAGEPFLRILTAFGYAPKPLCTAAACWLCTEKLV